MIDNERQATPVVPDWDRWCDGRIAAALAEHEAVLVDGIGQGVDEIGARIEEEIAEQIAQLKAGFAEQLAELRGEMRGLGLLRSTRARPR